MAEIFFSYSSENRERVRLVHDALVNEGFDVFWDQKVPPGKTWNDWIREQLKESRCVIVLWSNESVQSPNVIHEAMVAKQSGKLVPAMLDDLPGTSLPMGFLTVEAAKLHDWVPGAPNAEWENLISEIEAKVMPPYAARRLAAKEAEIKTYRARREHGTGREKALEVELQKAVERENALRNELQTARFDNAQKAGGSSGMTESLREAERKLTAAEKERSQLEARVVKAEANQLAGPSKTPVLSRALAGIAFAISAFLGYQWQDTSSRLSSVQSELWYLQSNPASGDAELRRQLDDANARLSSLQTDVSSLTTQRDDANARVSSLQSEVDTLRSQATSPTFTLPDPNAPAFVDFAAGMTPEQVNSRGDDYYFGSNGFTLDKVESVRWYKRATELGNALGMYNLGYMYELGEGGLTIDVYEAGRLYKQSADLGNDYALYGVGRFHQLGYGGYTQSDSDAVSYYQRSVDMGNRAAMYGLAGYYDAGTGGLSKDSVLAARYVVASMKKGHTHARDRMKEGAASWSQEFRVAFQQQLQTEGYYTGPLDGNFGPATTTAIDTVFNSNAFATP